MKTTRRAVLCGAGGLFGGLVIPSSHIAAAPARSDIKIKEIKTFTRPDGCFVKITSTSGHVGWGETCADNPALMAAFIHNGLGREAMGRDPFDTQAIWNAMFFRNHDQGPGGALANAIAGIDIALWDLKGHILDAPIHDLLGGRVRDRIRGYGSYGTGRWTRLTPEQAATKAQKFLAKGFAAVKCRMQIRESHTNPSPDRTLEYARAVRRAIGPDTEFWVDINNGYTAARAIQIGRVLQDELGMRYYEEPCSDQNHDETAQVSAALDMALIAGEKEYTLWQVAEMIRHAKPDMINPDVIKAAGITEMKKIASYAQAMSKPIILHNTRPTISTAASLQLAACVHNMSDYIEYLDLDDYADLPATLDVGITFKDGWLTIPDGPGLGIVMNETKLAARASSIQVVAMP